MTDRLTILTGDALEQLRALPDESVQMCVTSPPYWGLRDYGVAGQLGLEKTPQEFVAKLVAIFEEVRRVLKSDGTCWVNLGDSYAAGGKNAGSTVESLTDKQRSNGGCRFEARKAPPRLKPKDLCGIPWRVAFALQDAGWYLRSDIIWHKPNPMPESVTDRPTKAHEYLFLMSKNERYLYDHEAIKERSVSDHDSWNSFQGRQGGSSHLPMTGGSGGKEWKRKNGWNGSSFTTGKTALNGEREGLGIGARNEGDTRNKRDVWTVASNPYAEAHFATYPPDLIKPCILAGSRPGDVVLDPFGGSGTSGMVALELGRKALLIELNPEYVKLIEQRCNVTPGLSLSTSIATRTCCTCGARSG